MVPIGQARTGLAAEHDALVHPDGSTCKDGCDLGPMRTCLATPPVAGCNCGLVSAHLEDVRREHQARVAAAASGRPDLFLGAVPCPNLMPGCKCSTPASTIWAMAAELVELADLLRFRTDRTLCLDLARDLHGFARKLPTQDGGEDAAREVRHG
jgi:hypothetical protein